MRKRRFHILLQFAVLLLPFMAVSQTEADSLAASLHKPMHDSARVRTFFRLIELTAKTDLPLTFGYADSAALLCKKLKRIDLDAELNFKYGALYKMSGQTDKALEVLELAKQQFEKTGNKARLCDVLTRTARTYESLGNDEKCLDFFQQSLQISKQLQLDAQVMGALRGIGGVYRRSHRFEEAAKMQFAVLGMAEQAKDSNEVRIVFIELSHIYLKAGQLDSALLFAQKSYELAQAQRSAPLVLANSLQALATAHAEKKNFEIAAQYTGQTTAIYRNLGQVERLAAALSWLGLIFNNQGKFREATIALEECIELSKKAKQKLVLASAYEQLSVAYQGQGRYQAAVEAMKEYTLLRNEIVDEDRLKLIAEMDAKYQASEKDKALKISELEVGLRKRQLGWLVALAFSLASLVVAVFFGFKNRMRAKQRIAEQQDALRQQEIRQLEQANQLTALSAMLEGQEQERSRIAADLHDSLGGLLASIKSHFNAARQPNAEAGIFEKTNTMLDGAATEVRRISHNMMPRALALSGLKGALEDLAQDLERQGLSCTLELVGLDDLPLEPTRSVMAYRIVQELTHNAVKHAQATHLLLQAIQHEGRLTLLVEDDGKGFDVEAARQKKGLGLSSIESRVLFLKGEVEWDSVVGEGTTANVSFPL
jgi:two-component system, NarL family, sensor kinase